MKHKDQCHVCNSKVSRSKLEEKEDDRGNIEEVYTEYCICGNLLYGYSRRVTG